MPNVTRFLVLKAKNETDNPDGLKKISPFIIHKQLTYVAGGELKSVKKLRNGTLLVETFNDKQTTNLLKLQCLGLIAVQVEPHRQLNFTQGVISCWDFIEVPEEEIQSALANQGVVNVRRIKSRKSGQLQPTPSLILTFAMPQLPKDVKAAYYCLPVRPYIPSPLRCFKCQHYGHTSTSCEVTSAVCAICGTSSHGADPCTSLKPQCVNCKGEHTAWSRDSPVFKEEKRIRELMVIEKISATDAKRRVKAADRTLPSGTFSAAVARSPVKLVSVGTQTSDVSTKTEEGQSVKSPQTRTTSPTKQVEPTHADRQMPRVESPRTPRNKSTLIHIGSPNQHELRLSRQASNV